MVFAPKNCLRSLISKFRQPWLHFSVVSRLSVPSLVASVWMSRSRRPFHPYGGLQYFKFVTVRLDGGPSSRNRDAVLKKTRLVFEAVSQTSLNFADWTYMQICVFFL